MVNIIAKGKAEDEWVMSTVHIKKASLNFTANFGGQ